MSVAAVVRVLSGVYTPRYKMLVSAASAAASAFVVDEKHERAGDGQGHAEEQRFQREPARRWAAGARRCGACGRRTRARDND